MKLSIIIVSYNVRFFLEECLFSVQQAIKDIDAEVWVVDNYSADSSVRMIHQQFPWVRLIENQINEGFACANNRAIKLSSGEYVLLLNPDTVVQEDSLRLMIDFMDDTADAGAMGVKMIDGRGRFLPESKRGLPTPFVAFCKMSGLTKLFPRSSLFARYYAGNLDENEIQIVDILSGACMLIRKSVLNTIGLLDETFFMYGEDVDLSYRITQIQYHNYYFPHTTIVHYKGKSTSKSSFSYSKHFYAAMLIFTKKHQHSVFLLIILQLSISLRASLAVLVQFIKKLWLPFISCFLFFVSFVFSAQFWAWFKFGEQTFRTEYFTFLSPIYAGLMGVGLYLAGGYKAHSSVAKVIKGIGFGALAIIAFYAFSPEDLRFSRVSLVLAIMFSAVLVLLLKFVLQLINNSFVNRQNLVRGVAVVGLQGLNFALRERLISISNKKQFVGFIHPSTANQHGYIGSLDQISDLLRIHEIDTLLFCDNQLPHQTIIRTVLQCRNQDIRFFVIPQHEQTQSNWLIDETFSLLYPIARNHDVVLQYTSKKRWFDFLISLIAFLTLPIWILISSDIFRKPQIRTIWQVAIGSRTWVGYSGTPFGLPRTLKPVVELPYNEVFLLKYFHHYSFLTDVRVLFNAIKTR